MARCQARGHVLHGPGSRRGTARRRRATTSRSATSSGSSGTSSSTGGRRGVTRTASSRRSSRAGIFAGWPFGLVYWPLQRAFGTVVGLERCSCCSASWARAGSRRSGCASCGLRRGAALAGGLAFCLAPYLQAQWSARAPARVDRDAAAAVAVRARTGEAHARGGGSCSRAWRLPRSRSRASSTSRSAPSPSSGSTRSSACAGPTLLVLPALAAGPARRRRSRPRNDGGKRSFLRAGRALLGRATRPPLAPSAAGARGVRLPRLDRQLIALAGLAVLLSQRRWGLALALGLGALVPMLFALGANLPGYHALWRHLPGLRHTRVPERLMPIACLALAALVAVAVSRLRWPGTAAMVCLLLLVDLRIGLFHATAADEHNRAYAALRGQPAGACSSSPSSRRERRTLRSTSTTGCRLPARARPGTRRRRHREPTLSCASCAPCPALASPSSASGISPSTSTGRILVAGSSWPATGRLPPTESDPLSALSPALGVQPADIPTPSIGNMPGQSWDAGRGPSRALGEVPKRTRQVSQGATTWGRKAARRHAQPRLRTWCDRRRAVLPSRTHTPGSRVHRYRSPGPPSHWR